MAIDNSILAEPYINKRYRILKGQSKMNNPEKLETQRTENEGTKAKTQHNMCWTPPYTSKHNTICVGHHHAQVSTT